MGMFDIVRCEVPLPDGYVPKEGLFQTKDFDCEMTTYTITANGRLVSDDWHYEDVPKHERDYPDAPEGSFESIFGSIRTVVDRANVDRDFHGILNFYDGEGDHADGTWKWHEYNAKFTDGQLVEITLTTPPAPAPDPGAESEEVGGGGNP